MTTISDPHVPTVSAEPIEPQLLGKDASRSRLAVVVGVGLTLFAVLNATAAIYLYRGINDLRTVEGRLEELGAFEQRIVARLDTVNNGFQSRFERLDSQLQGNFNEINGSISRLEQNPPSARDDSSTSTAEPVVVTSTVADASSDNSDVAAEPAAVETPRPIKRRSAAPPGPNPAYQRTETPDGKVYYRKIN
ncbi:hypothetical protein EFV37_12805 [Mesorhizobium loti]|uniref:Uncharacterized protein n=1 Tax=Mesorhizobium jarvisii TaxID=1777867 RepID=A0A6M7TE81_9HYPH|nr:MULTISPECIES: hypothetical protein [Mesorhizobium]OBQ75554.1 hypothetical protein A9K72_00200 [Mesorhizobium loti]QKC63085.1 hypothetical protein EB229_12795 [Mesorhizobium jarvisii]QKD08996.1 hypothetical protein EFV37_12805 [Mesorhizobium loti]RJT29937.1 hypothetical protein D3242_27025 [Mesorhizobium jarvisii]BCH04113.1 hypothetical protein MesoLj131b_61120 [Mesorhizobium sp. 131-2-5]